MTTVISGQNFLSPEALQLFLCFAARPTRAPSRLYQELGYSNSKVNLWGGLEQSDKSKDSLSSSKELSGSCS
jgi:hypothetical protein